MKVFYYFSKKTIHLSFFLILFCFASIQGQNIDVEKEIEVITKMRNQDIKKTIQYTDSLLQYDFPGKIKIKLENGISYVLSNKPKKAILIFDKIILKLTGDEKKLKDLGNTYLAISQAYDMLNETDIALKNLFKGIEIGKKLNDPDFESYALEVISVTYFNSKDYTNAIKYSKKSIEIEIENETTKDNIDRTISIYSNIGVYFQKMKQLDSALYYNKKVILLNEKYNRKRDLAVSYNNIAVIYKNQKKYNQAIKYFEKSIKLHQNTNSYSTNSLFNLAGLYLKLKKYDLAKENYIKALNITKTTNNIKETEKIYSNLLKIGLQQKDYKNSLIYQTKRDSLNQINRKQTNMDKLQMVNTQFDQRKKEEDLKQKLIISKKNIIIFYITSILLLFIGLFFLQKYRNNQLKLNQEKLILQQKILRSQMTPHFIFNSLSVLQGMILNNEDSKAVSYLSKFSKLLRITLDNSREKLVPLDEELKAIQNYVDLNNMRSLTKFKYTLLLDENIENNIFLVPPMLIQPFIENSILHGFNKKFKDAEISINISFEDKKLLCVIKDNGVGLNHHKNKLNNQEKKSLSTTITSERLQFFSKEYKVKCNITIQDRNIFNEKGTQTNLTLPYKINKNA